MRFAAACAAVAGLCAIGNLALMAVAVDLEVTRLFSLAALIDLDAHGARWLVASMWVDALFYLALLPVAFALAPPTTSGDVMRVSGSLYALIGAATALALALKWPGMFARHAAGDVAAAASFAALSDFAMRKMWNLACAAMGAVWWLTLARTAPPHERALILVSAALGACSALEGALGVVRAHGLADFVLVPVLALLPLWAWVAARALHKRASWAQGG